MKQIVKVLGASFIASASTIDGAPDPNVSETVFLGRSNVGKSSLLNALMKRKNLAKTSSTPGKTRLINFYAVNFSRDSVQFSVRLVDMPGYGYAKVSKMAKSDWEGELSHFLQNRSSIKVFIHLIDSRHPELPQDLEVRRYILSILKSDQEELPVFTKIDKLNRKDRDALSRSFPGAAIVSSIKGEGIESLREKIVERCFGNC
jgi:GTP-binding protein